MSDMKLSRPLLLVGCGKMGSAMLSGWLESGIAAEEVIAVEPMGIPPELSDVAGVDVVASADELTDDLDPEVVVFAVKPQQMDDVTPAYRRFADGNTAFLSVAAARISLISPLNWAMAPSSCVRCRTRPRPSARESPSAAAMPRQQTRSGSWAGSLAATGEAVVVDDEGLIDAVTALSGGGPAYVFLLIECLARQVWPQAF